MTISILKTGATFTIGIAIILGAMISNSVHADSVRAQCGFSDSREVQPDTLSSCSFSQRQGFIRVNIDGGAHFELSPFGDSPGNYRDQHGNAIFRVSGPAEAGQLFQLPDEFLYVFWDTSRRLCTRRELTAPAQCVLGDDKLSFRLQATADSSLNTLRIKAVGLSADQDEITGEIDGSAYKAELADLDENGWPELYIYISSAGSGSYGSLVAYSVNNGASLSPVYLPPIEQSPETSVGYMGHDEFAVVENRLLRRFPLYLQDDVNAAATGGTRALHYRLQAGEAGWVLQLDRVVDYPGKPESEK